MIRLYTWTTPNGVKPLIMLEELGLPYEKHWINIGKGEQQAPAFLKLNPNGKIPALVDDETAIFESGAILIHLAEKTGQFLPASGAGRSAVLEWLFFQVGGVGPMFGQLGHFMGAAEKIPYAIDRYRKEVERLYSVLNTRLGEVEYLAGNYSIADIAMVGWAKAHDRFGIAESTIPHVRTWLDRVGARPAVQRATAFKPA